MNNNLVMVQRLQARFDDTLTMPTGDIGAFSVTCLEKIVTRSRVILFIIFLNTEEQFY